MAAGFDPSPLPELSARPRDGHKGTFGKLLVVGGSRGMPGAIALTANAALRSGAGLVTIACPESVYPLAAPLAPCATSLPLPETSGGGLAIDALEPLLGRVAEGISAVAIGPGLGRDPATGRLVRALLERLPVPWVADADALFAIAAAPQCLERTRHVGVLTPHPGEMARLSGRSTGAIQADRRAAVASFMKTHGHILVLKGEGTLVGREGAVWRNDTGNPGLATGGTGDVLTGVVAALLGQGLAPYDAARVAVRVHGRAGDLGAERLGERSLIATDLLDELPRAFREHDLPARP